MGDEPPHVAELRPGEARHTEIADVVELMRTATADFVSSHENPVQAMSVLMSASSVFCGTMFGALMIMGEVKPQDLKRGADAAARNFRSGVDVGKRKALRVAQDLRGGGHV